MTEFFNKKEEMLEIQLTEYGKYLLSIGKLSPVYYTFHDDEILYNSEYTVSGAAENQNDIDQRIRYNTPNLKVIPTRSGAQTRVERYIEQVEGALASTNSDPAGQTEALHQESFIDKVNFSSYMLGTGDMTTDKTAAWSVSALKNTIDSTKEYIVTNPSSSAADINNGVITIIPQINIDIDYQMFYRQGQFGSDAISGYLSGSGEGGLYLALYEDYLVVDVLEGNTNFQKENFDVEVYFDSTASGSLPTPSTLQQMAFLKDPQDVGAFTAPKYLGNPETNIGNVEYYFNLYLDEDLPSDIRSEIGLSARDIASNGGRFKFNRDIYSTDEEEPC
jgi:hypothetical protein